ncbi:S8 family peptidase [Aurantivibrio plasticivorans]
MIKARSRISFTLCAAVLASLWGCGGGSSSSSGSPAAETEFRLSGVVTGLNGNLQLSNEVDQNIVENLNVTSNGNFAFSTRIADDTEYFVRIDGKPTNQSCILLNSRGTIAGADVDNLQVECVDNTLARTVSGMVDAAISIDYDTDVNDIFANFASNDDFPEAQPINNIVTLHGFSSFANGETAGLDGRFQSDYDEFDFFTVYLQAGQRINLQIVDHQSVGGDFFGDLDLWLFDENRNEVAASRGTTEEETIAVLDAGQYFIVVEAWEGISKYVLDLLPAPSSSTAMLRDRNTGYNSMDFLPNQMIVKFKDGAGTKNTEVTETQSADFSAKNISTQQLGFRHQDSSRPTLATLNPSVVYSMNASTKSSGPLGDKANTLRMIKALSLRDDVEYAEPNYRYKTMRVPNDTAYRFQWHYPQISLPQAWDLTTGDRAGDPVIVGVIDTGIVAEHPDFQDQLVNGYDFISNISDARDGNGIDGDPDDPGDDDEPGKSSWHGTHVAGTIAARTNNGLGVAGVSWGAKVMPLRALGLNGSGSSYDIMQSLLYAAGLPNDSGSVPSQIVDVVNMSLGGPGAQQSFQNVVNQVRAQGVILVASAGNDATSERNYPAAYQGVVSVSAVDFNDDLAPYSNFGDTIDIAAPGGDVNRDLNVDGYGDGVLSTAADDSEGGRRSTYRFYQGTSMASPHVAGVVALMKAEYPELTPTQFDALLQNGQLTDDLGTAGRDNFFGYGRLNASKAVIEARTLANGGVAPPLPVQVSATPQSLTFIGGSVQPLTIENLGGGSPSVTNIDSSAVWLSVSPNAIDASGLGTYDVQVDRTGLGDGIYQTSIDVEIDSQQTLSVNVTMQVGTVETAGRLHPHYVLLIDSATDTVIDQTQANLATGEFEFTGVVPGEYNIVSGSDIENDFVICQFGESCGAYPSLNDIGIVRVEDSDIANRDIVADILGRTSSATTTINSAGNGQSKPNGYAIKKSTKQLSEKRLDNHR